MESKLLFTFFLVFSSWVFAGFSQSEVDESRTVIDQLTQRSEDLDSLTRNLAGLLGQGTAYADDLGPSMQCMQKLLPCQPYLHSSSPPATCCAPLEEMVANETECLCSVFDNPGIRFYSFRQLIRKKCSTSHRSFWRTQSCCNLHGFGFLGILGNI